VILFVDASAVVAMLAKEPDALELADRLDDADTLLWSPVVRWEASVALSRLRNYQAYEARHDVSAFGAAYRVRTVAIGDAEYDLAFDAYRLYGKGSGHAARLNMGDCFAYACAKAHQARLLYKGNDFAKTDLA
jgi:ribonuclease VapC